MSNAVLALLVLIDEISADFKVATTNNTTLNATEFKTCVNNDTSAQLLREDTAVNDSFGSVIAHSVQLATECWIVWQSRALILLWLLQMLT